ncbi:hypothetical protein LK540_22110 [Massilia sp. IC2-278]|uniref:hypothetical protein n=1 Tax=Massilia sp. IC2-278 TaxID=2887200 RepID=UPI001E35ABEA|nr:hypothetical protein [Massilia sp. IC2-278]MCC2963134.1 hypothetical protein [Massilia sp. IC2-278]
MLNFAKIIVPATFIFTTALTQAANLPDGIKGLQLGMTGKQVVVQLNKIYGRDVSKLTECHKDDDFQAGAGTCVVKASGLKYGGVDVESITMTILDMGLGNVYLTLATPKTRQEHDGQVKQVTSALASFLPMPSNVVKDDLMWKLDDGNAFMVVNNQPKVSIMYMSMAYQEVNNAKMRQEQEAKRKQKAKDAGL